MKESQPVYEDYSNLYKEAREKGIAIKDVKIPDDL